MRIRTIFPAVVDGVAASLFRKSDLAENAQKNRIARFGCLLFLAACFAVAGLTGCGGGDPAAAPELSLGRIAGTLHGGANPINGATVTLYETQTGATANAGGPSTYGSPGAVLATATTQPDGSFSFDNIDNPYTCTSTEFAYITAVGGNTGGNSANNQSVLLSPLGSCTNLSTQSAQSATRIFINEATTVASAYALGNFMTVTGAPGSQVVNIGAPPTNGAATGSCTVNGSKVTTACTAAGLAHAFANAYNLVDGVGYSGAVPTGSVRALVPGNSANDGVIPQALLNTIANAVQQCVNSGGGSSGDSGTLCGHLFGYTTIGSSVPTDTLTAAQHIAAMPTQNVSNIFGLGTPTSFFQPSLAAAPNDFTVGITYAGTNSAFSPYPWGLALDSNDVVYAIVADAPTSAVNPGSGAATQSGIAAKNANGANVYNYALSTSSTYYQPGGIAVDTLGNVFATSVGNNVARKKVRQFNAATGGQTTTMAPAISYPLGLAVDRSNNLWYSTINSAGGTLGEFVLSGTTYTNSVNSASAGVIFGFVAIDNNQNIWTAAPGSGGSSPAPASQYVFPAGSATGGALVHNAALTQYVPVAAALPVGSIALDSAGNAYTPEHLLEAAATPTLSAGAVTGFSGTTETTATDTNPGQSEVDGNGVVYTSVYSTSGAVDVFTPGATPTELNFDPCYVVTASGSALCSDNSGNTSPYPLLQYAHGLQVDSTGSIWVTAGVNAGDTTGLGGRVVQIIGSAAPTWPQLSYGFPGVKP